MFLWWNKCILIIALLSLTQNCSCWSSTIPVTTSKIFYVHAEMHEQVRQESHWCACEWVHVVTLRGSRERVSPFSPSCCCASICSLSLWLPSKKSLLSQSLSRFHIRVALSRHGLLSSQITAQQSGRSTAHPMCLKGRKRKLPTQLVPLWMSVCGVWFDVYGFNLHQLTNSINQPSEKSIECIMAHISQ